MPKSRATTNSPAASEVIDPIRASAGIGALTASVNQACSGNWALMAIAPIKMHIPAHVSQLRPRKTEYAGAAPSSGAPAPDAPAPAFRPGPDPARTR